MIPKKKVTLWKEDLKYIRAKTREKKSFGYICFLGILFLSFFVITSLIQNAKREYIRVRSKIYPYYVLSTYKENLEEAAAQSIRIYENYRIQEDTIQGYPLLKEEDSNFKIPKMIQYGRFPKMEQEILINETFYRQHFAELSKKKVIGKTMEIKGETFTISGILINFEESFNIHSLYGHNAFYSEIEKHDEKQIPSERPAVFLPYSKIKKIGALENDPSKRAEIVVRLKDEIGLDMYLNTDPEDMTNIFRDSFSSWQNKINNSISMLLSFVYIIVILLALVAVLALLFVGNELGIHLFYRQKEFGYLELFHVSKKRLFRLVAGEYLSRIVKALLFLTVIYLLFATFLSWKMSVDFFVSFGALIGIYAGIFLYSLLVIIRPLRKCLKKDILTLIR